MRHSVHGNSIKGIPGRDRSRDTHHQKENCREGDKWFPASCLFVFLGNKDTKKSQLSVYFLSIIIPPGKISPPQTSLSLSDCRQGRPHSRCAAPTFQWWEEERAWHHIQVHAGIPYPHQRRWARRRQVPLCR